MRVLVVEDEKQLAGAVANGLAEHGYSVDVTADGEDALHLALVESYDLVILDRILPKLDGLAVCGQLRVRGQSVPVLMLTARDTVDDRVAVLESGADDYLVKPFAFRELVARARALLRRHTPSHTQSKDPIIRVGGVTIDTVSHEVHRDGTGVRLTGKEYALLELFARNPNRVLTRAQIAERIWSLSSVVMSNVVDVYVGYLRRKLGDDHEPRLFHTVRGVGYQLHVPGP
jgi:DNA-binding response OmpR family regulator